MDIMLKGEMDGIEAARIIKLRFSIPVIYLTACTDIEILERAKLTEPAGYISKPFKASLKTPFNPIIIRCLCQLIRGSLLK
jgi:CheY-like chemotaxis protein